MDGLPLLKPYSFVLVDEDHEAVAELLLVDDDTECQFSTIELCATVAEEKAAKVAAVQYRCGETGEA